VVLLVLGPEAMEERRVSGHWTFCSDIRSTQGEVAKECFRLAQSSSTKAVAEKPPPGSAKPTATASTQSVKTAD
jgi:hypothetical protein